VNSAYITGCAGFLGAAVTRKLHEAGWEVSGCDSLVTGDKSRLDGIEGEWDWRALASTGPHSDVDVVVHTAAIARSMWPDENDIWRNNVDGTRHVLSWGIRTVHASSSMVAWPDVNVYCKSKEVAEWFVRRAGGTSLRFGNIWGDGQSDWGAAPNVIAAFRQQIREHGKVFVEGTGRQSRDFVHVDDAADAMVTAVLQPRAATADICTGVQTSIISIAEQFGVPIERVDGRDNDPVMVIQSPAKALALWGWTAKRRGVVL